MARHDPTSFLDLQFGRVRSSRSQFLFPANLHVVVNTNPTELKFSDAFGPVISDLSNMDFVNVMSAEEVSVRVCGDLTIMFTCSRSLIGPEVSTHFLKATKGDLSEQEVCQFNMPNLDLGWPSMLTIMQERNSYASSLRLLESTFLGKRQSQF
ncbi:hypothetical protein VNO77_07528 [Canavalia gladiata]|uniref:Uncharacterized protein n=1 Tax=Canavalia gladiata TaxID=3824 RepID=A0AAN9MDC9_CANGL